MRQLGVDERVGILPLTVILLLWNVWIWHGVASGLVKINLALAYLNENQPIAEIPPDCAPLLRPMVAQVNRLIEQYANLRQMRGQLVSQISEAAAQEERNRLARDLHDSIKQQVFSMSVSAAAAYAHLTTQPEAARAALQDVKTSAQEAMVEMRALLQQLSPAPLEKSGLVQALRDQCEALAYRTGASVTPQFSALPPDDRLPAGAQEALFRIAQEALSNIARHARASTIHLQLTAGPDGPLELRVQDDGQGFDPNSPAVGMGLANIHSRSAAIGAAVHIDSAPGHGTTLTVRVPLTTPASEPPTPPADQPDDAQLKPLISLYFQFAGGIAAFITTTSLIVWRLIHKPERIAEDGVLLTIFIIMVVVMLGALPYGIWALLRAQRRSTALLIQHGRDSRTGLKLRRHIEVAHMIITIAAAWFLPMPWIVEGEHNLTAVWIGAVGLATVLWRYRRMYLLYRQEVHQLTPAQRVPELEQRLRELRSGWPSIIFLLVMIFFSALINGEMRFPPLETDHWMNLVFFILADLMLANQIVSLLIYRRWRQQAIQHTTSEAHL
jgi:signal transduction histidine kinase